mmetsp:Transcript_12965/g.34306  ORF Transcript_12965/g.34306 Transcript_12965/m.34306 type:complete len:762 (-) Transcript_12965:427-2712(-)
MICSVNLLRVRHNERRISDLHQHADSISFIVDAGVRVELDHAIHAAHNLRELVECEARVVQGGVKGQPDHVLHDLIGLVRREPFHQLAHDEVLRVDLHPLLERRIGGHVVVALHLVNHCCVGGFHDLALQLLRRRQLALLLGDARREEELLDLEGVVGADLGVVAGRGDRVGDGLDPHRVVHCLADGRDSRVQARRSGPEGPGALLGLERHQRNVVLAPVAHHYDLSEAIVDLLHGVFDGHRRDVLPALADDQLLVPSGDLDHPRLRDHALVAGVQPALGVDRLGVLLHHVLHVGLAHVVAGHVAHHDVATAEAELALVLLALVLHVRRGGALLLAVDVRRVHHEGPHLHAGHGEAAAAPDVRLVQGEGAGTGALGHAVDLVDAQAQGAEVLQRVHADRSSAREAKLAALEAQVGLHLLQHEGVGERVAERVGAAAAQLAVLLQGQAHALRPGRDVLLHARHRGADGAHLVRDLLPDEGDPEEDGRPAGAETVLDRSRLEVVVAREVQRQPGRAERGHGDRGHDVHHHPGDVGEREVREDPLLLRPDGDVLGRQQVQHARGLEDDVVVRDHHGLRLASGAGGVDERRAVPGVCGQDPLVDLRIRHLGAQRQQLVPADDRHGHAVAGDAHRLVRGGLVAVDHDAPHLPAVPARGEGLDEHLDLLLVLDDDHSAARVDHLVGCGVRRVRGVEARDLASGETRRQRAHDPLRAVEAPDVDRVELLEAQGDHALGGGAGIIVELPVRPGLPLVVGQRRGRLPFLV